MLYIDFDRKLELIIKDKIVCVDKLDMLIYVVLFLRIGM